MLQFLLDDRRHLPPQFQIVGVRIEQIDGGRGGFSLTVCVVNQDFVERSVHLSQPTLVGFGLQMQHGLMNFTSKGTIAGL